MDEKGKIRYINTDTWEHFFGRAINVSHADGVGALMNYLLSREEALILMYEYGISCYEETWKSGTVEAKTLHFGTSTIRQKEFWDIIYAVDDDYREMFPDYLAHNFYSKLPNKTHEDVDESSINNEKS